jgi:hypothetical protein
MTTDRLETMAEAFKALAEQRFQVDRLVASELSGESFFTIKWKMISDLIDLGSRCQTPREAGNILEMLTEEIPAWSHTPRWRQGRLRRPASPPSSRSSRR